MGEGIVIFLIWKRNIISQPNSDVICWHQVAYFADVSNQLNDISLVAQGRSITVLTAEDKVVKSD
jgi:hypothetical protein